MKNNNDEIITTSGLKEELVYKTIIERMKDVELYPEFIKFYKFLVKRVKDIKIYFITGRKKKEFQIITIEQLSSLNTKKFRDTLAFFPDEKELTVLNYYEFKLYNILKIITEDNGSSQVNIYDDNCGYYDILKKRINTTFNFNNITYYDVLHPKIFWNIKNEEYKNLLKIIQKEGKND